MVFQGLIWLITKKVCIKYVTYKMQLLGNGRKAYLPGQKFNNSITQELQPFVVINPTELKRSLKIAHIYISSLSSQRKGYGGLAPLVVKAPYLIPHNQEH